MWPVHVHLTQAVHQALKGEKGDKGDPGTSGSGSPVWGHLTAPLLSQSNDVYVLPTWFGGDTWKIWSGDINRTLTEGENGGDPITLVDFWPMQVSAGNLSGEFDTELTFFPIKLLGYLDNTLIYETAITVGHIPAAGQVQVLGITIPPTATATLTVNPPSNNNMYVVNGATTSIELTIENYHYPVSLAYTYTGGDAFWHITVQNFDVGGQQNGNNMSYGGESELELPGAYFNGPFTHPNGNGMQTIGLARQPGRLETRYHFKLIILDPDDHDEVLFESPTKSVFVKTLEEYFY